MLMDPMGGIVMTNDGNAILREVSELSYNGLCDPYIYVLLVKVLLPWLCPDDFVV